MYLFMAHWDTLLHSGYWYKSRYILKLPMLCSLLYVYWYPTLSNYMSIPTKHRDGLRWYKWYKTVSNHICVSLLRTGAWSAYVSNTAQWITANFNGVKTVSSITTQGRSDANEWVTSYRVTYRDSSGAWRAVTDSTGRSVMFTANTDRNTRVTNSMPDGVVATNVRLWPVTWNGRISMRFLVQGCDYVGK